mmetsp:Transcript_14970/g.22516  ORF Transcript_14970/g.22516 Transcript_14970/m.22516 type:complete len:201 (-) Transcript_14970:625-1227(-)
MLGICSLSLEYSGTTPFRISVWTRSLTSRPSDSEITIVAILFAWLFNILNILRTLFVMIIWTTRMDRTILYGRHYVTVQRVQHLVEPTPSGKLPTAALNLRRPLELKIQAHPKSIYMMLYLFICRVLWPVALRNRRKIISRQYTAGVLVLWSFFGAPCSVHNSQILYFLLWPQFCWGLLASTNLRFGIFCGLLLSACACS